MSIFEALMLICFGASWPAAIRKTYVTKNVKGKSRLFAWLVIIGYLCGMIHKILYNFDFVFYLYLADLLLVATDLTLVYIYREKRTNNSVE
ncbi:MAG: hypothetical protein MJ180_02375 [Candidatus Gastranaerophilales bacterium]|nr:hypothetical protein [Candidatus Gastranaerophilales bacterium]